MRRFANKNDLPTRIKDALPDDAQQTYMDAMNEASDMPDSEAHGRAMHAVAKKHPGAPFLANPFTGGYGARESTGGSPRYASTADLPQSVKDEIPESDLEAYLEAINQVPEGTPEDNAHEIAKTACANQGRSVTKESGSPGDYLVVEDPKESSKWHLQVRANGKPDHRLMGAAWAALHGGYRGNKYEGPDKEKAIERLKALYKSENMPLPAMESAQMEPPEKNSLDAVQLIEESAALSAPKTTEG